MSMSLSMWGSIDFKADIRFVFCSIFIPFIESVVKFVFNGHGGLYCFLFMSFRKIKRQRPDFITFELGRVTSLTLRS